MRFSIFIGVLLTATLAVGLGSFLADASAGTTVWRMIVVLVALQVGYFLLVVITAYWPSALSKRDAIAKAEHDEEPSQMPVAEPDANPSKPTSNRS